MSKIKKPNPGSRFFRSLRQFLNRLPDRAKPQPGLKLLALEPRVLYDASPLGVLLDQLAGGPDSGPSEPVDFWNNTGQVSAKEDLNRLEIVFIDSSVTDSIALLQELMSRHESGIFGVRFDVYLIDSNADGVEQISNLLAGYNDLSAVHIVSTGENGVQIGASELGLANLLGHAGQLVSWRDALAEHAEILLYGSDVSATESGQQFLEVLGAMTGADVATSGELSADPLDGAWAVASQSEIESTPNTLSTTTSESWYAHSTNVILVDSRLDDSIVLSQAGLAGSLVFTYDGQFESTADVLGRVENWARSSNETISSLSILSHGTAGAFELGNQWITAGSFELTLSSWQSLSGWFTADATIDIYSCNVTQAGSDGELLLDLISAATGTDVFASVNISGVGGDWILESSSHSGSQSSNHQLSLDVSKLEAANVSLAWYGASWQYRQTVTISEVMVTGSSNLSNFAVLVSVTDANLRSTGNGGHVGQTDGGDFVFTSSDGTTKLDYQIESYNATTGTLRAWVSVPALSYNVDTSLYLYYGNAGVGDQWNVAGTWDSNYKGVWHLNENTGTTNADATSNANTATPVDNPVASTGQIGGALTFSSQDRLTIGANASLDLKTYTNWTLSAWVKPTSYTGLKWPLIYSYGFYDASLGLTVTAGTDGLIENWTNDTVLQQSNTTVSLNAWNHVVISRTATTTSFYLNGVAVGSGSSTAISQSGQASYIGGFAGNNDHLFLGVIDEVRVSGANGSAGSRSADWIKTEYNNQFAPGTYVSLASEEGPPVITSNGGGATASISISENTTTVTTVTATDSGSPPQTLSYSISGTDAAFFSIGSSSGILTFMAAPNYESPLDSGNDNVYDVIVNVSDGALTDAQAISVTVTNVNEAPINNVPGAQNANEDTSLVFSSGNGNQISVTDVDVGGADLQVTLSVTNGSLTLAGTTGLSFTVGAGTADTTMTFQGTVANINTALNGLSYSPTPDYNGSAQLTLTTVDSALTARELDYRFQDGTPSGNSVVNISSSGGITGVATDFNVTALSTALTGSADNFGLIYTGAIDITTAGTYTFYVGSDDGSILYIDGSAIVTNDGLHSFVELSNTVVLSAGRHTLEVRFFENSDTEQLTANYSGPDTSSVKTSLLASYAVGRVVSVTNSVGLTVNAVNDEPVRTAGSPSVINVNEDSANSTAVTLGMNSLTYGPGGGSDETAQSLTYKVTIIPSFMTLWLSDGTAQVTANSTVTLAELQGLKYKTVADANGSGNLSWTIQDSGGVANGGVDTLTENLAITFNAINDAPIITSNGGGDNASVNVAENTTAVTTVTSSDIDGGTATYSMVAGGDGAEFNIDSSTGVLTFALAPNRENPTDSDADNVYVVTVQLSDGAGGTDTQVISVTVTDVDEFDVSNPADVNAAANAVNENAANGTTVGIIAASSDADATTNTITYSLFDNAGGRFAIDANTGIVTVADGTLLDREAAASHDITIRATSADGSTADTVFTINLNDVDEFDASNPTDANVAANAVNENAANGTTVGIIAASSDADATTNTITYSLFDNAGGRFAIDANTGIVTVADGTLLDREAAASHDITVRATSADGSTADTVFTINLNDVDEFGVGVVSDTNASSNSVAENATIGTVVGITAFAQDPDGSNNTVTYSLDDNAGGRFAIDGVTGVVTVAGGLNYETATSHNITVRATSSDGSFSTLIFLTNVTDVNEFPVTAPTDSNPAINTVDENAVTGTATGITAYSFDADGSNNSVTYSLDDNAGGRFQVDAVSGIVTVLDGTLLDRESAASHNITVRATSSDGSSAIQVFAIALNDINEFPVGPVTDANGTVNSVNENAAPGTTAGITAQAFDNDATTNVVSWSLTDDAGGRFVIDPITGVITVAGLLDYEVASSHSVTVRALSQDGSVSFQTFVIQVNDLNEAPTGSDSTASTPEDTILTLSIAHFGFSDPDAGESLTNVRIDILPTVGQLLLGGSPVFAGQLVSAVDISAGNLAWQPPPDANGNGLASIVFTVADSGGLFAATGNTLVFDVLPVNDNPVANPATFGTNEDTGLSGSVSGSDIDSPSSGWNYQLLSGPANAASFVLNSNGSFTYVPAQDYNGIDSFLFRMHDGQGGFSDATVTINVVPVNDTPMSIADIFSVFQGSTLTETLGVLANDFDVDNDPLIAVILTSPSSGTLVFNSNGTFVYTPAPGFIGVVQFSYLASDGQTNGIPVQVTINVEVGSGGPGGGGGGGGTSSQIPPKNDPKDEFLDDGRDSLKNLLARLARKSGGADSLADTIDTSTLGTATRSAHGLTRHSGVSLKDDASRFDLIEQLSTSLDKYMIDGGNLELEIRPGGPRLVISMDGIWASLIAAEQEARASNLFFSVSPLAFGAGTFTFAAAISYLFWYLRGGLLMATLLTQIPTWRMIDPLPILDSLHSDESEVEEDMVTIFG